MPFLLESWHSPPLLNEVQRGHLVRVFLISSFYFTALVLGFFILSFCRSLGNRLINSCARSWCSKTLPARNITLDKKCVEGVADAEVTPGYFSNLPLFPSSL